MPELRLRVIAEDHISAVVPQVSLFNMFREHLWLTGAKKGCDQAAAPARWHPRSTARGSTNLTKTMPLGFGEVGITGGALVIANAVFGAAGRHVRTPTDHLGRGALTWVRPRIVRWLRMAGVNSGLA
jgi:hypothetical protein